MQGCLRLYGQENAMSNKTKTLEARVSTLEEQLRTRDAELAELQQQVAELQQQGIRLRDSARAELAKLDKALGSPIRP